MIDIGWFGFGSGAFADAEGVGDIAEAAEQLGYESVWLGEHPVLIDPQRRPSPMPPHSHLLDPVAVLAYAAARTTRVRLGTGIILLPLRNPVTLAKELASIDVLSKGRLVVGVGVGYVPGEYEALGYDFHTRGRRADECIDALRVLWHDDQPSFDGEFVSFRGIQCRPQPVQRGNPPILASGMSTAALRRAVTRCDGWYGFYLDVDAARLSIDELAKIATEVDRPATLGPLELTVTPPPGPIDLDTVKRYEDLGVARVVLLRHMAELAGGPDPATRAAYLDDMTATAERLGL